MTSFYNEQILKLDLKQQQPNAIPRFVRYDSAILLIELYDNGKKYDVSKVEEFVVSIKRPDGKSVSGLAKYEDGFIKYKLTKQDLEKLGEAQARLQIYQGRQRISSLSFRYDVYEDYETVGSMEEQTLLSQLFTQLHDALIEAQRQGNYAENRGDFSNSAGDFAIDAGNSQRLRWLKYVSTIEERNTRYPNPLNGDVVYVVNTPGKIGGSVFRFNGIELPHKWEEISGWDTSVIQDIYNLIGDLETKKETKEKVKSLVDQLADTIKTTRIGTNNLIKQTDTNIVSNDSIYTSITPATETEVISTDKGRMVHAKLRSGDTSTYYGVAVGNSNGNRFSVQQGETLTLSFIGEKSLNATDFTYIYLMRPNSEGANGAMTLIHKHDIGDPKQSKYEFSVKAPWSSNNAFILIGSNKREDADENSSFWIRFKDVSLVRGNRAGDWAPSFEDLVKNAQELTQTVKNELDNIIKENSSRIDTLENKVDMTVTESEYNEKLQQINQWQSQYEQTAKDITTTVNSKVGKNEVISTINQTAGSVKIDAKNIDLNGYVTVSNLSNGTQKVHPNALKDYGMTTISGGSITIDSLSLRRPDGNFTIINGEMKQNYLGQRYEPDFSSLQPGNENNRVWSPHGQYYAARLVDIFGDKAHSSWAPYPGYINARSDTDFYTLVNAYRVQQNARYLKIAYGVQTSEAGIMVKFAEQGDGASVSRVHNYREESSIWGNTYMLTIDLEQGHSNFGSTRLFYLKATVPNSDLLLSNSATRMARIRVLGVYTTDEK